LGILCCFCLGEGYSKSEEYTPFHPSKEVSSNADDGEKGAAAFPLAQQEPCQV